MNGGPPPLSLGDILGSVLARNEWEAQQEQACQIEETAMLRAAEELSRQAAPLLGVTERQVFHDLAHVPDSMLALLRTPEGWVALAAIVAGNLGVTAPLYQPTLH